MARKTSKKIDAKKRDAKKRDNGKKKRFPRGRTFILRKQKCRFCTDKNLRITYLDHQLLRRFTTERGKIIHSRFSGTCARHQRKLANAIKRARNIGLLPYVAE